MGTALLRKEWRGALAAAIVAIAGLAVARMLLVPRPLGQLFAAEAPFALFYAAIALAAFGAHLVARRAPAEEESRQPLTAVAAGDSETQVYAREYLDARFAEELARAQRWETPLSLVIVEVDHCSEIETLLGGEFASRLRRQLASLLRMEKRRLDVVGRWSAYRFALVLPETGGDAAFAVAERFRKAIGANPFEHEGRVRAVTLSQGIATFPSDAATAADLAQDAEAALNAVRQRGGNMTLRYATLVPPQPRKVVKFRRPQQGA